MKYINLIYKVIEIFKFSSEHLKGLNLRILYTKFLNFYMYIVELLNCIGGNKKTKSLLLTQSNTSFLT